VPAKRDIGLTYDRIVLATSSSTISGFTAAYAQEISKRFASSLSLVNVVDLSVAQCSGYSAVASPTSFHNKPVLEDQNGVLHNMTSAGIRTMVHTLESLDPTSTLIQFAKELRADLIITSAVALLRVGHTASSSDFEMAVRYPSCPVLMVGPKVKPTPTRPPSFRNVVIASDSCSYLAEETALRLNVAEDGPAAIHFCHLVSASGKDILVAAVSESTCLSMDGERTCDCIARINTATARILKLAAKVKADLIVLGSSRSVSRLANFVEGTATQLLGAAKCPVMMVFS
jgi:nucleotide-binding universal stress UspA family protein